VIFGRNSARRKNDAVFGNEKDVVWEWARVEDVEWHRKHGTAHEMSKATCSREGAGDVARWCLPVREYTGIPDETIERFERLCCKEDSGSKAPNVLENMKENMKLWFIKPSRTPVGELE
jgi:hypothetical protein